MLTETQKRAREFKTTASQAPIIMSGNEEKILRLWRERIGETEPEDLSRVWPVQLGSYLEPFILDWHERKTGKELLLRGAFQPHPTLDYIGATLDAYRPADDTVIDAKVCGGWQPLGDIVAYYTPQIIVQMRCRSCANGALLIVHGGAEPQEIPVTPEPNYERTVWERLAAFELCVKLMKPPSPLPRIVPPDAFRTIDLDALGKDWPNWAPELAFNLDRWRDTAPIVTEHEETIALIKTLLPDDVGRLDYAGMRITRNRRNAITIKEIK